MSSLPPTSDQISRKPELKPQVGGSEGMDSSDKPSTNIAQHLTDVALQYHCGEISLEQVMGEVLAAVCELDARTVNEAGRLNENQ
jgi:hypothetical protein